MEKEVTYYKTVQTIEGWVNTIETKFNDIPLNGIGNTMATIIGVNDPIEIAKIEQAGLIIFGKRIGILTFEDACNKLNIIPNSNILSSNDERIISTYKLYIIIEALNDGWKPNCDDSDENKWFPYFDMKGGTVSFSHSAYVWNLTNHGVFSPLLYKTKELAEYGGRHFIELYKEINA